MKMNGGFCSLPVQITHFHPYIQFSQSYGLFEHKELLIRHILNLLQLVHQIQLTFLFSQCVVVFLESRLQPVSILFDRLTLDAQIDFLKLWSILGI